MCLLLEKGNFIFLIYEQKTNSPKIGLELVSVLSLKRMPQKCQDFRRPQRLRLVQVDVLMEEYLNSSPSQKRGRTQRHTPCQSTGEDQAQEITDKSWGLGLSCTVKYIDILE